jgi:hypothetical protein
VSSIPSSFDTEEKTLNENDFTLESQYTTSRNVSLSNILLMVEEMNWIYPEL